ncbi:MAG: UDP-N-acetylglucosamine 1-carboxyvinyltransferase [Clostridia bacterium]|nr:UDP-N-acetylglucosamine 1-carboxyvinyltransferase [Clostridia bacterium]
MRNSILVEGGHPLSGEITVQGSKNAVLPILAATFLIRGSSTLHNCPNIRDVDTTVAILEQLGAKVTRSGQTITVDATNPVSCEIPDRLMSELRSSVIFLGSILSRTGEVHLSYPGG